MKKFIPSVLLLCMLSACDSTLTINSDPIDVNVKQDPQPQEDPQDQPQEDPENTIDPEKKPDLLALPMEEFLDFMYGGKCVEAAVDDDFLNGTWDVRIFRRTTDEIHNKSSTQEFAPKQIVFNGGEIQGNDLYPLYSYAGAEFYADQVAQKEQESMAGCANCVIATAHKIPDGTEIFTDVSKSLMEAGSQTAQYINDENSLADLVIKYNLTSQISKDQYGQPTGTHYYLEFIAEGTQYKYCYRAKNLYDQIDQKEEVQAELQAECDQELAQGKLDPVFKSIVLGKKTNVSACTGPESTHLMMYQGPTEGPPANTKSDSYYFIKN